MITQNENRRFYRNSTVLKLHNVNNYRNVESYKTTRMMTAALRLSF
jgi:hypothetical protein